MKTGRLFPSPPHKLVLLLAVLLATSSLAQQTETEKSEVPLPANQSKTNDGAGTEKPKNTNPEKSQAATRFTPSEKIRADDAVSFPVDI